MKVIYKLRQGGAHHDTPQGTAPVRCLLFPHSISISGSANSLHHLYHSVHEGCRLYEALGRLTTR
ncbi:MAG: hypothetical protein IJK84_04365 [Bacteroidales bacterium]|nr:hypothetical protein [Bacteroidales bacterium]